MSCTGAASDVSETVVCTGAVLCIMGTVLVCITNQMYRCCRTKNNIMYRQCSLYNGNWQFLCVMNYMYRCCRVKNNTVYRQRNVYNGNCSCVYTELHEEVLQVSKTMLKVTNTSGYIMIMPAQCLRTSTLCNLVGFTVKV